MNYRMILYTLGWVLNFEAVCMLLPMICAVIYGESCVKTFLLCVLLCLLIGGSFTVKPPKNKSMYAKEGFVIVAFSWIVMSLFGALPFVISKSIPSFINAFFETVSGFTTTGATILSDIEALPKSMLMWRSFTHWIGGMGVLVLLVAVLPLSGGSNLHLLKAESPGPSVSKLVPKIRTTALILYGIYTVLTVIEMIFLLAGGLSPFEAVTLSFATAGTGGFAPLNSSISAYSPYIQWVITIFMLLFGVNFSVYYLLLIRRFKEAFSFDEVKLYFGIVILAATLIAVNAYDKFGGVGEAIRHSAFQVASIITTTGYMSYDFELWPALSQTVLVMLIFCGACAGSTGGGIKVSRILILFKTVLKELKITVHPKSTHKIIMDGRIIEHETLRSVNVFIMSYAAIYAVSLLLISINGYDFSTNFTAIATTINNVGPGLAKVGPTDNFGFFSPLSKLVLCFDMLVGRLEIFPMLILFSPYTWKK